MLLGVANSIDAADTNLEQTIAAGMAQQLMDEIAGQFYVTPGGNPYAFPLGPDGTALASPGRSQYTQIADYNGYSSYPPTDRWGNVLGTDDGQGGVRNPAFRPAASFLSRFHQVVSVYYVSNANQSQALAAGTTSDFRAVRVQILVDDPLRGPLPRADVTRVFAYVPGT